MPPARFAGTVTLAALVAMGARYAAARQRADAAWARRVETRCRPVATAQLGVLAGGRRAVRVAQRTSRPGWSTAGRTSPGPPPRGSYDEFGRVFGERYRTVRVGEEIRVAA